MEGEPRQEARRVHCAMWHEVVYEKSADLPVLCHDECWSGRIWIVLVGDWKCDDAPVECAVPEALADVCGSGDVEDVNGDCDGYPVRSVMLQVIGVDVHGVGESGQSGSWENDVDHDVV